MGQIYNFLGLKVGVIVHGLDDEQRKVAYDADVTYGTNNELGFDYLRDNMKYRLEDMVQRGHIYAIVDEVDSILVDEARTPLIISGPLDDRSEFYNTIDTYIPKLEKGDYEVDEKQRTVTMTEAGMEKMEQMLRADDLLKGDHLYEVENVSTVHHVNQALRAHKLFHRDKDYIEERRGGDHRRVHRPHDAGAALFGRAAPGAGGQGAPADPAGEPDAGLDHLPELLPHVREAGRHDRHGDDGGRRVHRYLQSRGDRGADQHADGAPRRRRRGLPHGGGEIPLDPDADRGLQAARPAGAGGHHLDREVGATGGDAAQAGLGAARLLRPERVRRALQRRRGRLQGQGVRDPQCPLPREGGLYHRAGRGAGRHHDCHQHGRPRHRHSARWQRRHAHPPGDRRHQRGAGARARPARGGDPRAGGAAEGEGAQGGRALRAGHRTAREPAHRQPAARPLRAAGRSRALEVLPVAGSRPDADLRDRQARHDAAAAGAEGERGDRALLDQQGAGEGAAEGGGAQLRHPQEPAEVRQRDERPAQGDLRAAGRMDARRGGERDRRRHAPRRGRGDGGAPSPGRLLFGTVGYRWSRPRGAERPHAGRAAPRLGQ